MKTHLSDIEHAHKVVFKLEFPERIEPPTKVGFEKNISKFSSQKLDSDWSDSFETHKRKKVPQDTKKVRKVFHGFVYAIMEIDSPIQG